jgi:AcrR family transcriptional regulator
VSEPDRKRDGRVSRGKLNRAKIALAYAALIREGVITPTAEQVALRAGVGRRTVFRHFEDMEALFQDIARDAEAEIDLVMGKPIFGATWHEAIGNEIDLRCALYERFASLHIAAQITRYHSPSVDETQVKNAQLHHDRIRSILPAEVTSDMAVFQGLLLLMSIETWIRLRREQSLDVESALGVIRQCVFALVNRDQGT